MLQRKTTEYETVWGFFFIIIIIKSTCEMIDIVRTTVKPREFEHWFSKYSLIRNKFGTELDLFVLYFFKKSVYYNICFGGVKETSTCMVAAA